MTFTQNSGTPVSFIGTDSTDTLVLTAGQPFSGVINPSGTYDGGAVWVQAEGGADIVTTNGNVAGVTIYAGSGNDDIDANGNGQAGQFTNGQVFLDDGDDLFTYNNLVTSGVNGGDGGDFITAGSDATSTASSINGNAGDDFIFITGRAGDTGIYGGQGDDTMTVSTSTFVTSSVINGNKGADQINIYTTDASASAWSGTEIRGGQDADVINLIAGTADLEGVYGDLGNDRLVGSVVGTLSGTAAAATGGATSVGVAAFSTTSTLFAQTITAYDGDITAFGGEGNDNINGGNGFDTIDGGNNADSINGRAGNDTLTGGDSTWTDTFVFGNGSSIFEVNDTQNAVGLAATGQVSATVAANVIASIDDLIGSDLVTDYDLATDGIQLSNATFASSLTLAKNLNSGYKGLFGVSTDGVNVNYFGGGADGFTDAVALVYDQTTGELFFTIDNTSAAGAVTEGNAAQFTTLAQLNANNSHLIATLDTTPNINGTNFTNEITIIS